MKFVVNVIYFRIIAACALIFHSIIPFQLPLFFLLLGIFFLCFITSQNQKSCFPVLKQAVNAGFLPLIVGLVYIVVIAVSGYKNELAAKEGFRVITVIIPYIALFFSFKKLWAKKGIFSGNSHFSIPLFAIFSLLPFLTVRKINVKDN